MTVTPLANGLYDCESETNAEVSYVVSLSAISCTCPDFRARRSEKALDDPRRCCKHLREVQSQPAPTALERAATVAEGLSDADLKKYASEKVGTAAACACLLELAARKATAQPKPIPAGVMELLQGATEAEKARALEIYR